MKRYSKLYLDPLSDLFTIMEKIYTPWSRTRLGTLDGSLCDFFCHLPGHDLLGSRDY